MQSKLRTRHLVVLVNGFYAVLALVDAHPLAFRVSEVGHLERPVVTLPVERFLGFRKEDSCDDVHSTFVLAYSITLGT